MQKFTSAIFFGWLLAASAGAADLSNVLGVAHSNGKYYLTKQDFLNEGCDQVLRTGSKVIKLYLMSRMREHYPWNSSWPGNAGSLVDLAQSPYLKAAFAKPFRTYVLTTYSVGRGDHYWTSGISPEQMADETRQFHDLTKYLLTVYRGTGKTFILAHWEGDWALRDIDGHTFDSSITPPPTAIDAMNLWLNARQAGINSARAEVPDSDVHVYGAAEANRVVDSMAGKPGVANSVLPHTSVDLVSYSAWDTQDDAAKLGKAVDFLAAHLPRTAAFGQTPHSVYIGEYGAPENGRGAARVNQNIDNVLKVVKDKGVPWAVYWQIYCNELEDRSTPTPVNGNDAAVKGYWLIKPDGTPGVAWQRFAQILTDIGNR